MIKTAAVIGAGPAGLSAAECLAQAGVKTQVYERMPSPARKFLLAGRGGLNLTHSEDFARFLLRYGAAAEFLTPFLTEFSPEQLRQWCADLGEETFIGTSGRVFPKSFKASPLLRAWLRRLAELGVEMRLRHSFKRFENKLALFETPEGERLVEADAIILALGGASWPRLGADGSWVDALSAVGVAISPLLPANCGFEIGWSDHFRNKYEGRPLKNVRLSLDQDSERGECVVTKYGLQGGAVYSLSSVAREKIATGDRVEIKIDLCPDTNLEVLASRLARARGKQSMSNFLRKTAHLDAVAIALAREAGDWPTEPRQLAERIKSAPLHLTGVAGIERAISTAGGVQFDGLDQNLMVKMRPGVFVAGEMVDWEAPTGGYLLTACMAMGRAAGKAAAEWIKRPA